MCSKLIYQCISSLVVQKYPKEISIPMNLNDLILSFDMRNIFVQNWDTFGYFQTQWYTYMRKLNLLAIYLVYIHIIFLSLVKTDLLYL